MRDPKYATRQQASDPAAISPQSGEMRLNPKSGAKIMRALIKLYANPWEAVLREYASNALDAHRRAGQTKPILITLPTYDNPVLVIEDFGTGMNWDEILNIYLEIGTSTKEDDNTQIGNYGFGAKSAIMVAERFEILTRKDGREYHIECVRNAHGIGVFNLLQQQETAQANGFKVSIPAPKGDLPFSEASVLTDFFIAWPLGSVLVNGKQPVYQVSNSAQFTPVKFGDDILGWLANEPNQDASNARIFASLGGVCYPVAEPGWYDKYRDDFNRLKAYRRRLYMNLPLGSVEVSPSRESLQYDETTKATLATLLSGIVRQIEFEAQQRIESAPTQAAAFEVYLTEHNAGLWTLKKLTYRGQPMTTHIPLGGKVWIASMETYGRDDKTRKKFTRYESGLVGLFDIRQNYTSFVRVADEVEAQRLQRSYPLFVRGAGKVKRRNGDAVEVYFHTEELPAWVAIAGHDLSIPDYRAQVTAGRQIKAASEPVRAPQQTFYVLNERYSYRWSLAEITAEGLLARAAENNRPLLALRKDQGNYARMIAKLSVVNKKGFELGYNNSELFRGLFEKHTVVMLHTQTLINRFEQAIPGVPEFDTVLKAKAQVEYDRVLAEYGNRSVLQQFMNYNRPGEYSGVTRRKHAVMVNFALLGKRDGFLNQLQQPAVRKFFMELSDYSGEKIKRNERLLSWFNMRPEKATEVTGEVHRMAAFADNYPLFTISPDMKLEGPVIEHLITYLNTLPTPRAEVDRVGDR